MKTFVSVPGFRVDFWTRDLQITNEECYSLDGDARALLSMADHSKFHTPSFQVPNTFLKILFPNNFNLREQVQHSRCREEATGRTFLVAIPGRGERYSSYPQRPCWLRGSHSPLFNPLKPELNPICYLLALLGAHHFLHVSRIGVKLLTLRRLISYIYIYIYIWSTHSWCF